MEQRPQELELAPVGVEMAVLRGGTGLTENVGAEHARPAGVTAHGFPRRYSGKILPGFMMPSGSRAS